MDFNGVIDFMHKGPLSDEYVKSIKVKYPDAKIGKGSEEISEKIDEFLMLMGGNKVSKAIAFARGFLVFAPRKPFDELKRRGVFRCSKYGFKSKVARAVIQDLLVNDKALGLDEDQVSYLRSVDNLLDVAPKVRQINDGLMRVVASRKSTVIKTLLAVLDIMFSKRMLEIDKSSNSDRLSHYSNEDLADAFCFILKQYRDELGVSARDFLHVDETALSSDLYVSLLVDAAKICHYKDAEVLLDGFPYQAVRHAGRIVIESIDPRLEYSIRLGYMQTVQQMLVRRVGLESTIFDKNNPNRPASMRELAKGLYEASSGSLVPINPHPIPRFIVAVPPVPELLKPFSTDELFEEEVESLYQLAMENYEYNDLGDIDICEDVTAMDILKLQRFFRFISVMYQCASDSYEGDDCEAITLRSVLPRISSQDLTRYLDVILPGRNHQKILSLTSMDLAGADHMDIQYTPLIRCEGGYLVAPTIVANSNLVRNIFCAQKIKQPFMGGKDPMQSGIARQLEDQGFMVEQELTLGYQGKEVEIDIVAFKDGHLFLIECKNAYHPCNVHEMRNSYSHIAYAAKQLTLRKNWLSSVEEQKRLFSAANFPFEPVSGVHTCVAIANRVFNGFELDGHPVRQGHELMNTIRSGVINIMGVKRRVWANKGFEVSDLIAYLRGETTIKDCMDSLDDIFHKYAFREKSLEFSSCYMDINKLMDVSKRYPEVS